MKLIGFLIIYLVLAFSSNKCFSQSKKACADAKTQMEVNICMDRQYKAADKEMNAVYKMVLVKLSGKQKNAFIIAQKSWLVFRDDYAKVYGLMYEGGSGGPATVVHCKTESTQARISELKILLKEASL